MSTGNAILDAAANGEVQLVGLTVEQYDFLIERGELAEDPRTELIDGFIVLKDRSHVGEDPLTVGDRHRFSIIRIIRLGPVFERSGCYIQSQQPIVLPPDGEPEPDIAVIRGVASSEKPRASDVVLILEVADSSLRRDLGAKLRTYARAKVPCYVVVDLQHDVVLVHRVPVGDTYQDRIELRRGDVLELPTATSQPVKIAVDDVL